MKKENTLQEVQEQISELQEEREKCDVKLKQLQNQGKKLEKLANEKERKRRNHRLIQRGLIVERVIKNPLMFTNDEIEELLKVDRIKNLSFFRSSLQGQKASQNAKHPLGCIIAPLEKLRDFSKSLKIQNLIKTYG